jgi:RNA polymerase sigma-70 factor (ECF subfamily)
MNPEDTANLILIRRALDRDPIAQDKLVARLTPVIHARVVRTLLPRRAFLARQEVEDLTQDVWMALFADDGRVLRSWDPKRGASLPNFVGLVAERQVLSYLRNGKRNPQREEPLLTDDELETESLDSGTEEIVASREQLSLLLDRLREELSPQGWQLFDLLFIQELSPAKVQAVTGLSADAVYQWRSRLRREAKRLLAEMSETPPPARKS